jgi:uncharacterized protein YbjT (DUF2867 family)
MNNYNANNNYKIVTIFGGSGFVGSFLSKEFIEAGYSVNIITRNKNSAINLKTLSCAGKLNIIEIDYSNERQIENCINGADYIINLIASFDDSDINNFQYIHAQLPEKIAKFCSQSNSVQKFIHLSNLGIDNSHTMFAKTRLLGESAVTSFFKKTIILRSSLIVGEDDAFLRVFIIMAKKFKFLPLFSSKKLNIELQPIYVGDLARSIRMLIEQDEPDNSLRNIKEIAGPEIFTLNQIYDSIKNIIGFKVYLLPINIKILKILAGIMSWKIFKPIHGIIFGINKSPISSEKLNSINLVTIIRKRENNLLFKFIEKPKLLKDVIKKTYNKLF